MSLGGVVFFKVTKKKENKIKTKENYWTERKGRTGIGSEGNKPFWTGGPGPETILEGGVGCGVVAL